MARYMVTGCSIVNDMLYADGRRVSGFIGGSIYVVNGIIPYTDDVLFVTTGGPDYGSFYGDYFRLNGISAEGVQNVLEKTQYTLVEYDEQGQWKERSVYGPEYDGQEEALIIPAYIIKNGGKDVKGIYFESSVDEPVWKGLEDIRRSCPNASIMLEVWTGDTENEEKRKKVLDLLEKVDVYSINRPEAMNLFSVPDEKSALEAVKNFGKPCFFRVGTKGSYMVQDGEAWFAPSVDSDSSVDSTGCGNCSTGGAMYGFCEGFHPLKTAVYANVAAGYNAKQFGPYPHYTDNVKKEMKERAEAILAALEGEYDVSG